MIYSYMVTTVIWRVNLDPHECVLTFTVQQLFSTSSYIHRISYQHKHIYRWTIRTDKHIVTWLWWLETTFGLVIGFINHLQVVTTITYNTVTHLHNLQSLHANLLSLPSVVFTYSSHGSHTSLTGLRTPNSRCTMTHIKSSSSHNKSSLLTSQLSLSITCCT
jgi:hypothetical protein